ncbi:hypothetical protein D3C76_1854190 [compost metagenome]
MLLQHPHCLVDQLVTGCIRQCVVIVLGQLAQAHRRQMKAQEALFLVELVLDQAQ